MKRNSYWTICIDTLCNKAMAGDKLRDYKKGIKQNLKIVKELPSDQKEIFIKKLKKYSNSNEDPILEHRVNKLINVPNVQVVGVYHNQNQIAGALLLNSKDISEIRYYYIDYNYRKLSPLNFLIIALINDSQARLIDLSGLTGDNDSKKLNINSYKNSFGGYIYEFKRFKFLKI